MIVFNFFCPKIYFHFDDLRMCSGMNTIKKDALNLLVKRTSWSKVTFLTWGFWVLSHCWRKWVWGISLLTLDMLHPVNYVEEPYPSHDPKLAFQISGFQVLTPVETRGSGACFLTHWGRDKMAAIVQTTFSNAFSWMKMYKFQLRFHWSLFPRVQLTIFHHWFR